jgi:hypothetical protein
MFINIFHETNQMLNYSINQINRKLGMRPTRCERCKRKVKSYKQLDQTLTPSLWLGATPLARTLRSGGLRKKCDF